MKRAFFLLVLLCLAVIAPLVRAQQAEQSEREAMYYRYLEFASYVKGGSLEPHWMADGSSFWYAEGAPAHTVIWKIDSKANSKSPLFDTARVHEALTPLLGHEPPYKGLPFEEFTFVDETETVVKFTLEGKEFILHLDTYATTRVPAVDEEEISRLVPKVTQKTSWGAEVMEVLSPDRRWFAGVKEHNLWLRSTRDGRCVQITNNGSEDYEWDLWGAQWSPDSTKLAVYKVNYRKVPKIPVVHWLKTTEEVEWVRRAKAGEPIPQTELFIVDVLSKRQVRVDIGQEPDQYILILGWQSHSSELLFFRMNRQHKKLDLMAAKPTTGVTRVTLTETQTTFILGFRFWSVWSDIFTPLQEGNGFVWMSERDGWNHLYLYNMDGELIRRLTEGAFPVLRVVAVDEKSGWLYFTAHGDQQRPYDTHLYRVNLEGMDFARLTEAPGQHEIVFAPSKEFFLDTHSSVNRPPVVALKRADGTLLQTLSRGNIDALKELQWRPPEEFVVKAADGKTGLHGVLYKPYDFDPNKKYPVIEEIYAGPQGTHVPRTFTSHDGIGQLQWGVQVQALAQLGFIVFTVDGRGTPERGKEFQDVVYRNFGRHEIPDHMATLEQLAEERPYMDLNRVGILGYSWGGYFALRALLLAPDVYHVGIAGAPVVDMYDVSAVPIESYMGPPQNNREGYEYGSNTRLAANLKGKLLFIVGTSDSLFSHTIKMVQALIRAGKPYNLLVFPEQDHLFFLVPGKARRYYWDAVRRYFQEHLKP